MDEGDELNWTTIAALLSAATLALFICFVSLSQIVQIGPNVGDIVVFEARGTSRDWPLSTIVVDKMTDADARDQVCVLSPSVMGITGGSLVIEAKVTTEPPSFHVHWSGAHTDVGSRDCGTSVDLTLPLASLRVLANSAGGFRGGPWRGMF
jgi:hypothetical protein